MFTLEATRTIRGFAATPAVIDYVIHCDEVTTSGDSFKVAADGQLTGSAAVLYTVPASTQTLVNAIDLSNTSAGNVAVTFQIGVPTTRQIWRGTIPANGSAQYTRDGWKVYDANGVLQYVGSIGPTGSTGGTGPTGATGGTGATGTANSFATVTGNSGSAIADSPTDTLAVTGVAPLNFVAADNPETLTATISAATTSAAGSQSAIDKKKEDNLWYDVTANSIAILVGNDSTDNTSLWNTLFAGLPVGATVYFPAGTYRGNFVISADKHLNICGAGRNVSIIRANDALADPTAFHINGQYWYNTFSDLGFASTSTTASTTKGIYIDPGAAGSAVGINIYRCDFQGLGTAIHAVGIGAANVSVWSDITITCPTTVTNSRGMVINGANINMQINLTTINMNPGSTAAAGSACVEVNAVGALQVVNCDWIGGINTLLLNANNGSVPLSAAQFTNCFFDQSGGSTVKFTGTNAISRITFVECGITGGNVAGSNAVEIAGTGTGAAGTATAQPDGIDFLNCNIYPNSGTGTTNGFLITGAQGVQVMDCRISGWTNGIQVTPSISAGYTKVYVKDNKMGATNNFTTPNTVGVLLNAGSFAYGAVHIADNDFAGSTTAITDNSAVTVATQKNISGNLGTALPGSFGTLAVATTALTAATDVVIPGTLMQLPTNGLRIGSRFRFTVSVSRPAVGTATTAWSLKVKFGTAGTAADAAIATFTSGATSAVVDQQVFVIIVEVTALGATATCKANNLAGGAVNGGVTGLGTQPQVPTSTATFNAGATTPFVHVDGTGPTASNFVAIGTVEVIA